MKTDEYLNQLNKAIEATPGNNYQYPELYFKRSTALYLRGDYNNALKDIDKCISLLKSQKNGVPFATYYYLRGDVERKLGQYERAIEEYTFGLNNFEYSPTENPMVYFGRAVCYKELGQKDLAESDFEEAR